MVGWGYGRLYRTRGTRHDSTCLSNMCLAFAVAWISRRQLSNHRSLTKKSQPCTVSRPPASSPRWFHHRQPLKNDRALQPRAPCSPRWPAHEPRRPRRRGGQDVGDMRVGRADPGASDLNSHPAGKPWNPRDRGHRGAAAALRLEKRQPQQLGGMGSPAHLFFLAADA